MKKIFLMLVAALMVGTATVNAQIWGGQLILRGGFAANNFKGDNTRGIDMLPGYNFSLDFNKNFYKGAYWNTGVMFGTRGFDVNHSDAKFRAHNFNIHLTVGYKYMAGKIDDGNGDDVKIGDIEDYKRCDGGLIIGMGVWYKRINIDYTFKRGFGEVWEDGPAGAVNHMIRLGYAF